MDNLNLTAVATLALLIQYFIFSLFVGAARYKTGVKAPATTGDPFFEATFRIQHNTLEQLIHVIPALWICSYFLNQTFAVVCASLFFIGRILFFIGYRADPEKRALGFIIGMLSSIGLILGGAWGVTYSLIN
tara:strand:- start:105 stop:500 length:396 start_codon:yes stop_codon:yes gene_type:complete